MYLTGIADLITAVTGLLSFGISLYLVLRISRVKNKTDEIEELTNSNFSRMQSLLQAAMDVTRESAGRDRQRTKESADRDIQRAADEQERQP